MRKIGITLVFLITLITAKAQISLENTFTSSYQPVYSFVSNSKGIMYYKVKDTISNQIIIYNQDYSIYKTITVNRPTGYSLGVTYPSEQLFNTNTSIEIFICLIKVTSGVYSTKNSIYDENSTVIKDFGTYNYYASPFVVSNGSTSKLMIKATNKNSSLQYIDEVYSLPGNPVNRSANLRSAKIPTAYPNPSNTIINLPYQLDYNESTTMYIYNSNGLLIEQKNIDSTFDRILLNVQSYQPGIYIYTYNGISNRFIVE